MPKADGGFLSFWLHIVKNHGLHAGWEDVMQKWYEWREYMKKKDEKKKMEEMHQRQVEQMMKSAAGSAGLLHKMSKPMLWRRGAQILEKDEEDARLLDRCEAKRKEWATHWQCAEEVQKVGSTAKAERVSLGRSVEIV